MRISRRLAISRIARKAEIGAERPLPARQQEPFDKLQASARRLSPERIRTVVETLLFVAERPLSVEELRQATGVEADRLEKALDQLSGHYREGVCGVVLHEVAGGWQLRTSPTTPTSPAASCGSSRSGSPAPRWRPSPSSPTGSRSRARRSRTSAAWTAARW